ncbi:helix-turn-helix domain-containing protein [Runella limosa]|jgi:transcriptional regulator with XRE-family HTH domain|uniref:helix-turn-helix domain-containing protein n=1 Tax=Runella limosa TaxID=370978 RepID=UPI0004021B32|nr:helix-turn-helix transcriptional regulator [Runella limosa]
MKQEFSFGLIIKRLIDSKGDTLEDAAKKVGGSKSNISKILKKKDVNTELLRDFADAYGVGLGYFFQSFAPVYNTTQSAKNVGIQAVAEKIMPYEAIGKKTANSGKNSINEEILIERLKRLESENKLLREMVELLKSR